MIIKEDQIIEMENRLLEAIKVSDVETLDKMLHNDLLFITPLGHILTKSMDLASHRAKAMVVERVESAIELVNIIGDNAVVTVVYNTKGKMHGNPIEGVYRYIRIWKNVDGRLQVIGGSCTQLA